MDVERRERRIGRSTSPTGRISRKPVVRGLGTGLCSSLWSEVVVTGSAGRIGGGGGGGGGRTTARRRVDGTQVPIPSRARFAKSDAQVQVQVAIEYIPDAGWRAILPLEHHRPMFIQARAAFGCGAVRYPVIAH
ncbi:hypothetical protein CHU98_g5740 [Xylaria longipes]|nr:hypothetical protein CHU98_g5740 [Xylaria longipes]